jgi:hypothetical protein
VIVGQPLAMLAADARHRGDGFPCEVTMTRPLVSLVAGAALVAGCTPGSLADRTYPSAHPASAEAPPTPFVRPANALAADAILPGAGEGSAPMEHAAEAHADGMAHGGAGHAAAHGGATDSEGDRPAGHSLHPRPQDGVMPPMDHNPMEHEGSMPGMGHQ